MSQVDGFDEDDDDEDAEFRRQGSVNADELGKGNGQRKGSEMRQANSHNTRASGPVPIHRSETLADFSVVLRLTSSGTIVKNKGGSEELAGAIAYAQRLVELAGDLMGLDSFQAMECVFREGRCLIFSEPNGDTVSLRPRAEANIQSLRDSLGL